MLFAAFHCNVGILAFFVGLWMLSVTPYTKCTWRLHHLPRRNVGQDEGRSCFRSVSVGRKLLFDQGIYKCQDELLRSGVTVSRDIFLREARHARLNFSAKSELANIGNFARHVTFIQPSSSNPLLNNCEDGNNAFCVFTMTYFNNLSVFGKYLRSTCAEIFTSCFHNGKKFDCCEYFLPVDTFEGTCFAINSFNGIMQNKLNYSIHNRPGDSQQHGKMASKQKQSNIPDVNKVLPFMLKHGPGNDPVNISVEVAHPDLSFWYLGNTNIPSKMYQKDNYFDLENIENLKKFRAVDIYLRAEEIVTDHSVYFLEEKLRACRFWDEHHSLKGIRIYSNSACEIECLREAQMRYCGCVLHILPNQKGLNYKYCNISGIRCTMNGLSKERITDFLTKCDCITNCGILYAYIVGYVPHDDVR